MIVKFGDFRKIEEEYSNFKKYVQPFIGGGRNSTAIDVRRTPHLGGIMYSLLGADKEGLEDFGSFYRHGLSTQIIDVLNRLFLDTCGAWYANAGKLEPRNLSEEYQQLFSLTIEKLGHSFSELQRSVHGTQKLYFNSLHSERPFKNPIVGIEGPSLMRSTYACITHGDFNHQNLLIDTEGHTWLIDFQSTGRGHILRDVAKLDTECRLALLAPEEATLEERLCMEEALCSIDRFSQLEQLTTSFSTDNQALAKLFEIVMFLRSLARQLVVQNPDDDMSEYYIALFYNAMNMLRFYRPLIQREHALLCASLLADHLRLKG